MNITSTPTNFGSAFRNACFSLTDVDAPGGMDIEIMTPGDASPLGTKRIYTDSTAQINVAPYVRRLLSPVPMCDRGAGIHSSTGRNASCYIAVPSVGVSSAEVNLCGGTEDTPIHTLLSAAPQIVKIAPGERDEMSILVEDGVYVEIAFRHGDYAYFDRTDRLITTGMAVGVVDVDAVCATFTRRTGAPATEMGEFEVRLRSDKMDSKIIRITRNYVIDRENKGAGFGRRLAWINRFGAVDYCTFPTVSRYRAGGGRTTVVTNNGLRTVGTSAGQSIDLMSEPCSPLVAEWLAGIFSSPAVWTVDKGDWERVEVKAGEVVCEASKPAVVCVTIAPSVQNVSRCF